MFRPSRLLAAAVLAVAVYAGFYAVPSNAPGPSEFDPSAVARYETAAWQAGLARDEWSALVNCVLLQRELHRYSWFRAAQSGLTLSRLLVQFPHMNARFDRALPGLEEIARVEQQWKDGAFEPPAAARKQLTWWMAARRSTPTDRIASEMSEEYALRYAIRPDQAYDAALGRAEAFHMILGDGGSRDWSAIEGLLEASYRSLKQTLERLDEPAF
jgi:hypothetical protein